MKHTIIRVASPKSPKEFTITLCEAHKQGDVNVLKRILQEGGGIVEVSAEVYAKPKKSVVWRA